MKTKISIIIPIFNSASFLERCFNSVEGQTMKDIEFILVDDGSTDNSDKICLSYTIKDKRFKYFYKKNGGLSSARNFGIKQAVGEYIIFLDSDDYIEKETCRVLYDLAFSKNIELLNFGYNYIHDNERTKRNSVIPKNTIINKNIILEFLQNDTVKNKFLWFSTTYFYKREFLIENNLSFNSSILLGEDSEFNLRCLLSANRIYSINDNLYNYVFNENSLTQANYKENLLNKFYSQFESRLAVHKNFNLVSKPYLIEISRNYLEHSLFELFSNIYRNETNNKNSIHELKLLRSHELFKFCVLHYKASNSCPKSKKILIFLFKNNFLSILNIALKVKI